MNPRDLTKQVADRAGAFTAKVAEIDAARVAARATEVAAARAAARTAELASRPGHTPMTESMLPPPGSSERRAMVEEMVGEVGPLFAVPIPTTPKAG